MKNLTFDAGKIVRLTADVHVTIGQLVEIDLHPSGTQFDGLAVVVSAFRSNDNNIVQVVSLTDPTQRKVTRIADDFADFKVTT